MRKFLIGAFAALFLVAGLSVLPPAPAQAAAPAGGFATKVLTLLPSAARTASVTGSSFSTAISTQPVLGFTTGLTFGATVYLSVTAASSGTLDLTIQGSPDNGTTWFTLSPLTGGASAAWTQVTTSTSSQVRNYIGPLPGLLRAVGTGASTPVHTYSVIAVIGG